MCNLDSLPPWGCITVFQHSSLHGLGQRSFSWSWKRSTIPHNGFWQCTWCDFKFCTTVWVCAHSNSHRQANAWQEANRHHKTESQLQKRGNFYKGLGKICSIYKPSAVSNFWYPNRKQWKRVLYFSLNYIWGILPVVWYHPVTASKSPLDS